MSKNILLVGGTNVPAVVRAATRRGYDIVAANFPESFDRVEPDPSFIHIEHVDFSKVMPTVRRLVDLHETFQYQGVVSVSEYGLLPAAMVARQLNLPGTPLGVVQNTRDKARMRRTLEAKGLGQVRFRACSSLDDAREFFSTLGGPMIIKPVMGTGSDGVSKVSDAADLAAAWQLAGGARAFGGVICEEYIEGPEVSVECVLIDGQFIPVAITDKTTDTRFLEIGHSQPTNLSPAMQHRIYAATHAVVRGLGITDAVTHTEMRLSPRGPVLIETHTRMGGDFIDILTRETTGVDFGEIHVALALGEKPVVRPQALARAAAVRFATAEAGRIMAVEVPEASEGIREITAYVKRGDRITGRSSSLDRLGHVIATGADRTEADRLADETLARCRFDVGTTRLLFIGGSDSLEMIEAAERRGIDLVVMQVRDRMHRTAVRGPIIAVEPFDLDQPLSGIVSSIVDVAQRYRVSGIVPVMEFGLMPGCIAAAKLGFPAFSVKAVRVTRDKMLMRRALDAAGLGQIAYAVCRSASEVRELFTRNGGPVIVKPVGGSGSDGVTRVDHDSQIEEAWALAASAIGRTGVICEQYIEGPEVSVEGYSVNGRFVSVAITDKTTNTRFVEIGHDQPSRLAADVQQRIFDYTARVLAALGITDGWTHTEVRLGSSDPETMDPVIVETHTRRGGASIDLLTRYTTGVSIADVTFDFALGIEPVARPRDTGVAASVRFLMGPPGAIASIDVPELPRHGIAHVQIDHAPGDSVSARSASASRIGHVVATGPSVAEAIASAEELIAHIDVQYAVEERQWTTPAA